MSNLVIERTLTVTPLDPAFEGATEHSFASSNRQTHSVPLKRVRSPFTLWQIRRRMRKEGVDPNWTNDQPLSFVWVLQKNSGVPKRVRAISCTSEQHQQLNDLTQQQPNCEHYSWKGFEVQGVLRGQPLQEVHALVSLRESVVKVTTAHKVSVDSIYAERTAAERECLQRIGKFPDFNWAVVTYPVGRMLF